MKKLGILTICLVATLPFVTSAQGYTTELQSAYNYAYAIGITTMSPIGNANMHGNLIRSHMAKMMVNYAKNTLGLTPDTSLSCNFTDIAGQSAELQGYIKEACQLGLMGQDITAFNPNGTVTRAQFGTVLSRALWGDFYNGSDPYYLDHLLALKEVGIMTKIDTPNTNEIRGYVMLMMMRAEQGSTTLPAICETPENIVACALELDMCPSECQSSPGASAGTITVSKATNTHTVHDAIAFDALKCTATQDNVVLKGITLKADVGTWTTAKVWLEKDEVRITAQKTLALDNTVKLSIYPGISISPGSSITLDVFADKALTSLTVQNIASIDASAKSVAGSFPIVLR